MSGDLCRSVEQKKLINETFLPTIMQIRDMHKINKEKYEAQELCFCRHMVADHYLSVIESSLIGLLSDLLVCAEQCFQDVCNRDEILNDLKLIYDDIYKPLIYCKSVSTRFVKLFQELMQPIDKHFIDKLVIAVAKVIDDYNNMENSLNELLQVIIDYVDFFLLSLYGLVLDCNQIKGEATLPAQCEDGSEFCPLHSKMILSPKVTVFLLDDLVDYNLEYIRRLVSVLTQNYTQLDELDLVLDFRFITVNNTVDMREISDLIKTVKSTFKSVIFRNMNLNLPCLKALVEHQDIKEFVVLNL